MTETAVEAAAAAARSLGLTVTDPLVLYTAFSAVVHLQPSPVVARVPMNLPDGMRSQSPPYGVNSANWMSSPGWLDRAYPWCSQLRWCRSGRWSRTGCP
jgi:hypothetical protein